MSRGQIVAVVVAAIILLLLGFLIGYFSFPKDESDCRTFGEQRNDEIKKKDEYHSKLYKSLKKAEIGKNLR
jgi:hypothetical protein